MGELNAYLTERFTRIMNQLNVLRLSHDALEHDLITQPATLRDALRSTVQRTFNQVTVDGDPSTNDTVLVLARLAGRRHTRCSSSSRDTTRSRFSERYRSSSISRSDSSSVAPVAQSTRWGPVFQACQAKAAPRQPARKRLRLTRSSRSLPNWSPSLPRIGVVTAAETRKPVSTQVVQAVLAPNSSWKVGSAGKTIVCWNENAVPARVNTASVTLWCCRAGSIRRA